MCPPRGHSLLPSAGTWMVYRISWGLVLALATLRQGWSLSTGQMQPPKPQGCSGSRSRSRRGVGGLWGMVRSVRKTWEWGAEQGAHRVPYRTGRGTGRQLCGLAWGTVKKNLLSSLLVGDVFTFTISLLEGAARGCLFFVRLFVNPILYIR